jgi:DNA-binding IclR family transcriptional regulator
MQHQRSDLTRHEERRRVEAAVLALMLAEDWPWRAAELARRLGLPAAAVRLGVATLRADGLVVAATTGSGKLRASWAAVRCDELVNWRTRPIVESGERNPGDAIPL